MTKNEALTKLKKIMDDIPNLYGYDWQSPELKKWQRETEIALKKIFDDNQHLQNLLKSGSIRHLQTKKNLNQN
jgi:hypothetical protein